MFSRDDAILTNTRCIDVNVMQWLLSWSRVTKLL